MQKVIHTILPLLKRHPIIPDKKIKYQRLPRSFFLKEDVVEVSRQLLGKYLVTQIDGQCTAGKIIETEAYRADGDKACHAYNNRRTKRTEVMFWQGGTAYVYLCYGIHHLFNIVTGPTENAQAVLIRAIIPANNLPLMLERRDFTTNKPQLTAGPGVMSKALGIQRTHTGMDLCQPDSIIWVEDRGEIIKPESITASPRVGIDYAEECVSWPWRFRLL